MELTDAINHLKESLADPTHKWGCEECKQEHEQLLEWLEDYKRLKDEMIPAYDESEIDAVIAEIQRCTDLSAPGFVIRSAETLRDEIAMLKDYKKLKADYIELKEQLRAANTENEELRLSLKISNDLVHCKIVGDAMWNVIIEKSKQMEEYLTKPPVPADKPCGGDSNAEN